MSSETPIRDIVDRCRLWESHADTETGVTSWEQYRQVVDAIAQSNGWDDATAALQLLSHLEGDALNVGLLVLEARRTMRPGLVGALTERYGSPGWLAEPLGTWATLHDSASYLTDLLLAMTVMPCADICIVFHWRLPSGILLTAVGCGRATLTPRLGGLVNRVPSFWTNRDVGWKTDCSPPQ